MKKRIDFSRNSEELMFYHISIFIIYSHIGVYSLNATWFSNLTPKPWLFVLIVSFDYTNVFRI